MFLFLLYKVAGSEKNIMLCMCAFAGDEDDSVDTELEKERDGSMAGNLCHRSRYVMPFNMHQ